MGRLPSSKLEGVTAQELAELLKENSNRRLKIERAREILEHVENDGDTRVQYQEVRNLAVKSTINLINNNLKEIESIDAILEELPEHFDYKLQSMKARYCNSCQPDRGDKRY